MHVEVSDRPFDPWQQIAARQSSAAPLRPGAYGATAVFIGTMRDFNENAQVQAMTLEHYSGMTERYLGDIAGQAAQRWSLLDVLIVHRVGSIAPGEPIVAIAAWSAHRSQALAACQFLIEELKARAPFWKREKLADGERWVAGNTPAEVP